MRQDFLYRPKLPDVKLSLQSVCGVCEVIMDIIALWFSAFFHLQTPCPLQMEVGLGPFGNFSSVWIVEFCSVRFPAKSFAELLDVVHGAQVENHCTNGPLSTVAFNRSHGNKLVQGEEYRIVGGRLPKSKHPC